MPGTTLDTNVLLDVLLDDPEHASASASAIEKAAQNGAISVGPVTVAELVTAFARDHGDDAEDKVREFLSDAGILARPLAEGSAATAGMAYAAHLKARDPRAVECASCGKREQHKCGKCGRTVAWRAHILTDFLIGAHARHDTGRILTRDPHLHKKIPGLAVIVPN